MIKRTKRLAILAAVALTFAAGPAQGQAPLKEKTVGAPTRLDWQFASRGFSTAAARLPASYDSQQQRYQLYVPPVYKANKAWPLVVFISPGDQPMGWTTWKKVCQEKKVFFCSPYAAGNSCPAGQRTRIVLDMIDDVRRQYRIDPDQTYLSGFSGGGRMACAIGFSLPEWFGGVAPVCGTNPISEPTYLRHRVRDRLSVAFITGVKDFNRKENEEYMQPWFEELEIRSRLWVAPGVAHAIPSGEIMSQVYAWLEKDLERRRQDARKHSLLAMNADATPTPEQQATRHLEAAETSLKQADTAWQGVTLLQGAATRWSKLEAGQRARSRLKQILNDEKILESVARQGAEDEQKSLTAQGRALERFGASEQALQAWASLAKYHPDTPAGKFAAERVRLLRVKVKSSGKLK